jgi:hypothetical protein
VVLPQQERRLVAERIREAGIGLRWKKGNAGAVIQEQAYGTTKTFAPTCTFSYSSTMCVLCMRKQPCETAPPIEPGLLVP